MLQTEKEAEQRKIEATGIRGCKSDFIRSELHHLSPQWRLEVMSEFADSPNSKLILTNGEVPGFLLSVDSEE